LETGAIVEQRRLRLSASNIRQFAPKCHLVGGLPVFPQQQAFDAFAAAPGGTSSVSRGVFFRMEGAHRVIVSTPGSPLDEDEPLTTIQHPHQEPSRPYRTARSTAYESAPTVPATITGTNAGAALAETIALTLGPFFRGTFVG